MSLRTLTLGLLLFLLLGSATSAIAGQRQGVGCDDNPSNDVQISLCLELLGEGWYHNNSCHVEEIGSLHTFLRDTADGQMYVFCEYQPGETFPDPLEVKKR